MEEECSAAPHPDNPHDPERNNVKEEEYHGKEKGAGEFTG